ncbi:hypothetical protein SteCoe_37222 [Stentor coeruleus]|uniref:Fucolectin tachylectin-4 pentraxin-1 domain-containing protein n=1 Tax=Stentor coeruleus TaxID=5963 RepID=A0A1R2ANK6_9CILI|nr:hypothetical protein SteCoe_37222 [Stentor coeruleus]
MIIAFFVQLITLSYSQSCASSSQMDFTFYFVSGTDDWLVSPYHPSGTWAPIVINPGVWISMPDAPSIWDSSGCACIEIMTITRSFFLPIVPSQVNLYVIVDDYGTATVNGKGSCSMIFNINTLCDMTSSVLLGLNELKIVVTNSGGPGGLSYKLEAYLKVA